MSRFNDEADDYDLEFVTETSSAWGVRADADDDVVFLPKSVVDMITPVRDLKRGSACQITIPNWLAEREELC